MRAHDPHCASHTLDVCDCRSRPATWAGQTVPDVRAPEAQRLLEQSREEVRAYRRRRLSRDSA